MSKIKFQQLHELKKYYYEDKLCMREIAEKLNVSIDAVVYFMRKHHIDRRNFSQINKIAFANKPLSFSKQIIKSSRLKELEAIGAMLYWGEGYKKGSKTVDFANSDSKMILIFLRFLREIYQVDETRLRVLLYCYSDQNIEELVNYWSNLTKISKKQFTKPYVRHDFNPQSRKMVHGLIHIRYSDKKLFLEIKKTIDYFKNKYC